MLDNRQYKPILRWKRGEWDAIRHLDPSCCKVMTPLFEVTPKAFDNRKPDDVKVRNNNLRNTADDILQYWGQDPIFLDTWLLPPNQRAENGMHPIAVYTKDARDRQLTVIPVINLRSDDSYRTAISFANNIDRNGICVRLFRSDLARPSLPLDMEQLLGSLHVYPDQADLLVDLQIVDEVYPSYEEICSQIPALYGWRTFTIAGGAFPKDLSHLEKNSQHEIKRSDWMGWRDQAMGMSPPARVPSFGDYAIQYALPPEDVEHPNISASIRYTSDEYWVIMRGEGLQNDEGPGYEQYRGNAQLLCEREEFRGAKFSYGDDYIEKLSHGENGTGCPETLLRAGLNHHLTLVANQIASLCVNAC